MSRTEMIWQIYIENLKRTISCGEPVSEARRKECFDGAVLTVNEFIAFSADEYSKAKGET